MKYFLAHAVLALSLIASSASAQDTPKASDDEETSTQMTFALRGGVTGDIVLADPNFYGIGGVAEPTISFDDQFGVGLRIDGMALFGIGVGDDVQAGIRVLAAVLPKVEYRLWKGPVQPFVGLAGGYYTIAVAGASVSADRNDVGAIAGGGQALGVAPQLGIELGSFRIAALSHLVFAGELEPVFALELSWNTFSIDF